MSSLRHRLTASIKAMFKYWKMIGILCLISSLARFALDSYFPSLPAIAQYFNVSEAYVQLTLSVYLFGFGCSQLIYGPLSDSYGRKKILLLGLGIFLAGTLLCVFAGSLNWLLLGRLIAGLGAGACGVLNRAIASDCFQGSSFSKAWSYTTTTLVITLSLAPIFGGYIQEFFGWQANFIAVLVFISLTVGLILKFFPETHHVSINPTAVRSPFNIREIARNYYSILTNRYFIIGTLSYTAVFSGLIVYFQVSPLLLIQNLGYTPSQYGWFCLIIAVCYLFGGLIVSHFSHRFSLRIMLLIGSSLAVTGGLLMGSSYWLGRLDVIFILAPAAIYVIGARIVIPNALAISLNKLRHSNGSSSALIGCMQMLGSSLISWLITFFDQSSTLPLAIFLSVLGSIALITSRATTGPLPQNHQPLDPISYSDPYNPEKI